MFSFLFLTGIVCGSDVGSGVWRDDKNIVDFFNARPVYPKRFWAKHKCAQHWKQPRVVRCYPGNKK